MQDEKYLQRKQRNLSKREKKQIVSKIAWGLDVNEIVKEFNCSRSQVAGLKAGVTRKRKTVVDSINSSAKQLFHLINPKTTFKEVILPKGTMENIQSALSQIQNQTLIFKKWAKVKE